MPVNIDFNAVRPEDLHSPAECDKLLRADPSFSGFRCTPSVWRCPVCRRVWVHVCDEAEGCSYVHHEGAVYDGDAVIRGMDAAAASFDETKGPGQLVSDDADCMMCGDTGLMLGGWMGPTKEAPWPRPCTSCDCGRAMTPRAVQLKVMELVQRDLDSNYFRENENGQPEPMPGWWAAKYGSLLDVKLLDRNRRFDVHDAEPFDIGDQDIAKYVTDDDLKVLVTKDGIDPPYSEVASADVWKILTRNGQVAVKKHRFKQGDYFECQAASGGDFRTRCTEPRRHAGPHSCDATGRTWT